MTLLIIVRAGKLINSAETIMEWSGFSIAHINLVGIYLRSGV